MKKIKQKSLFGSTQNLAVTTRHMAELLEISPQLLLKANKTGTCPAPVKLGGAYRWPIRMMETWLNAGCPDREAFKNVGRN